MASCEELLQSIHPGRKLDRAFFLKIYGYEISFPGFADEAIKALNDAGCGRAREYYDMTVSEYKERQDRELKPVARQIRKQWEEEWKRSGKGSEERRKQKIVQGLHRKSDRELLGLLQMLN